MSQIAELESDIARVRRYFERKGMMGELWARRVLAVGVLHLAELKTGVRAAEEEEEESSENGDARRASAK